MRRPSPLAFLAFLALLLPSLAAAQTAINVTTLAQLRAVAATPGATITLAPGTYWLTGPATRPSPAPDHPVFLDLSGAGTTYVFTGVTLRVDTRELRGYGRAYGHSDTVRVLQVSGAGATVTGLSLVMEHVAMNGTDAWGAPRQFTADWSTTLVELVASGVTLRDCAFTTGGSYPYGYGDAFGKGGRPADADGVTDAAWIDHRKHNGIRLGRGASNLVLDRVVLHMRSYGQGVFLQDGVSDITIRDCVILGDTLASSDTVRAHPVYQQWGFATYGQPIPAGIRLSRHEDAIRVYVNPDSATNGWPQHVRNLTVQNTRIERMRDALATGDMTGFLRVSATEAYGCEQGFTPSQLASENTFTACKGDAVNGPLVFFRRSATNVSMQVELAGESAPVGSWPVALISGSGHQITLTRSAPAGLYPSDAYINVSQAWREWRHRPATDLDASSSGNVTAPTTGSTIINQTGLPLVFGPSATGNNAVSPGGVINKGSANLYTGRTLVPPPTTVTDTWGPHLVFSGTRSATDLSALGGLASDPGTIVSPGATLLIAPALQFQGEPLSLGGTLSSPGTTANTTRFNSSGTAPITLTADATIAVTTAANQFLVGPVSGAGTLTKTGPGDLVMEGAANTYTGPLVLSAGIVTARANKARHDLAIAPGASFRGQASLAVNQPATAQLTLDGTLVVNSRNDASVHVARLGRLTGAGLITSTGTGLGTVEITGDSHFTGQISGPLALTKTGASTLTLTAAHTYAGPTQILGGTLAVSGQLPSTTALSLAAETALVRDLALPALAVASLSITSGARLRPAFTAPFDPRRAYAWPVLTAASVATPTLDPSALPATTGTYALTATATTLTITHTPTPFAAWQLTRAIPHDNPPTADHDANGHPDLLDYALAFAPSSLAPSPSSLSLTFLRARPELTYEVESSTDLATWSVIATNPGTVSLTTPVTVTAPLSDPSRRFLRLRVTR